MRRACLCIAVTITVHDWTHGFVCNTVTQHRAPLVRRRVWPRAHCSCMAARIAVVAPETDETIATALGQRLGGAVVSFPDVMKGRKGRKTDKVKATAAYDAITAAAADDNWVLTGFPENAQQATLFEKLGGSFDHLVVVQSTAAVSDAVSELVEQYKDIIVEIQTNTSEIMAASVLRVLDSAGSTLTTADASADAITDAASSDAATISDHAQTSESTESSDKQDNAAPAVNRQTKLALKAAKDTTTAAPTAAKLFDASSSDAIAVPWYAAVAKTTSKGSNKKSAVTTAALALAAAADATPSKIVQTLGAPQTSSTTDSNSSSTKSKKKKSKAVAAAVSSTMFGDIELDIKSAECLVKAGITEPTPIQSAAMARIAAGKLPLTIRITLSIILS
jgi:hypothetical protein